MGWRDDPEVAQGSGWASSPTTGAAAMSDMQANPFMRSVLNQGPAPSFLSHVGSAVKEGALPMAGAIGGAALGTPLGPAGIYAGEAAGSAGGETLNQLTGLKHRSVMEPKLNLTDIGISAAAPGLGRGIYEGGKRALNVGARMVPGAGAAIQEWGAKQAQGAMSWLKGRIGDVGKLYDAVGTYNPVIDTPHTLKAAQDLLSHYSSNVPKALEDVGPVETVKKMAAKWIEEMGGGGSPSLSYQKPAMSFQKLRGGQKLMNEHFDTGSGTLKNAYAKLQEGIQKDYAEGSLRPLNQTVPQATAALKQANTAFKKQKAYEELEKVMQRAIGERPSDQMVTFNRGVLKKALRDNEEITRNLDPGELTLLRSKLDNLGIIPQLPPAPGQHVGSSRTLLAGALGGLAGGYEGYKHKHPYEGAGAGTLAGPVLAEGLGALALTPWGRNMILKAALTQGKQWMPGAFAAGAAGLSR